MKDKLILKPKLLATIALASTALISAVAISYSLSRFQLAAPSYLQTPSVSVPKAVTALGRLEPQGGVMKLSGPSSAQGARIDKLLVEEGQRVKAGEVVAILDNHDRLQAALKQAKQQVQVARANLAKVRAGAQTGEIVAQQATIVRLNAQLHGEIDAQQATIARLNAELRGQKATQIATVARTEAEQRNAQSNYQRYQTLYANGAISAQELESRGLTVQTTKEQVNESQATLNEKIATLQQQLNEAKANRDKTVATLQQQINEAKATLHKIVEIRPTDVQVATAEVESAVANFEQAKADLELTYVRTPVTGEILKIHTRPGETISNKGIVEIGQTNQMLVVAEIFEGDIEKVRLGQQATIASENQAFAGEIKGTVIKIGRQIGKQDVLDSDPSADIDARVVEVKIKLDTKDNEQVSGLTYVNVVVKINS